MVHRSAPRPHLLFALGGDGYVVPIDRLREMVAAAPLTRVPGAPPWIRGLFNLRGSVVPLIDVGIKIGVGTAEPTPRTTWVVVELEIDHRRQLVAFEADEVHELVELDDDELLATPPTGTRLRRDCVRGMVPFGGGFALVLDLERVLAAPELLLTRPPGAG